MDSPFIIPLGAFLLVILLVAIISMAKIHERETDVAQSLRREEMEHRAKMQELERELARAREGR